MNSDRSLALRFALAGEEILIGSRDPAKAAEVVRRIEGHAPIRGIWAATNNRVAQEADIVFVTVPYEAQAGLLEPLAPVLGRKVVVSTVAPVVFDKGHITAVPVPEGSAAAQVQRLLPEARVVAAFQNVSAVRLWVSDRPMEGDVVVCSDYQHDKEEVMALAQRVPNLRGVDGGTLGNSRYVEEITALPSSTLTASTAPRPISVSRAWSLTSRGRSSVLMTTPVKQRAETRRLS